MLLFILIANKEPFLTYLNNLSIAPKLLLIALIVIMRLKSIGTKEIKESIVLEHVIIYLVEKALADEPYTYLSPRGCVFYTILPQNSIIQSQFHLE